MKNTKKFYKVKTVSQIKKNYSSSTHQIIKLPRSLVEQTFCYKDLQEYIGICFASALTMQFLGI